MESGPWLEVITRFFDSVIFLLLLPVKVPDFNLIVSPAAAAVYAADMDAKGLDWVPSFESLPLVATHQTGPVYKGVASTVLVTELSVPSSPRDLK